MECINFVYQFRSPCYMNIVFVPQHLNLLSQCHLTVHPASHATSERFSNGSARHLGRVSTLYPLISTFPFSAISSLKFPLNAVKVSSVKSSKLFGFSAKCYLRLFHGLAVERTLVGPTHSSSIVRVMELGLIRGPLLWMDLAGPACTYITAFPFVVAASRPYLLDSQSFGPSPSHHL